MIDKPLNKGIDISIPFRPDANATSAWYVGPITVEPVRMEGFIGSVSEGGAVNFMDIGLNPHGNGTHTECIGHISPNHESVNQLLKEWIFDALLITIDPIDQQGDQVLMLSQFQAEIGSHRPQALIVRTLPNSNKKLFTNYSNANPCYMEATAAKWLADIGVEHLLIDTPSVDREEDGGALAAHRAFWNYPEKPRKHCTITELIYVPEAVNDGEYTLFLQVAPIENDASPSRPVIFPK